MRTSLDEKANMSYDNRIADDHGSVMQWEDAERFLEAYQAKGRAPATLKKYQQTLSQFYERLPLDKRFHRSTLAQWRDELLANGYSNASVNTIVSACNQFLSFIDKREYQVVGQLETNDIQPELTRNEYKRLLSAAKMLDDERGYLLVKIFVCIGIYVQELPQITVENVTAGRFTTTYMGVMRTVRVPPSLQQELLAYARRNGIRSGAMFLSRNHKPLSRTSVTQVTSRLSETAQVSKEKCNPRCLRKLYLATRATVEANIEFLVEQAMDRQIEQEQIAFGWSSE